jgi:hypothetical protein
MKRVSGGQVIGSSILTLALALGFPASAAPVLQGDAPSTPSLEEPAELRPAPSAAAGAVDPDPAASSALDAEPAPARPRADPRRPPATQKPPGDASPAIEIDPELKDAAKEVLELVRQVEALVVPEALSAAASAAAAKRAAEARPESDGSQDAGSADMVMPSVYLPPAKVAAYEPVNLIEEAKRLLIEALEHPVTLVLAPLVFFAFAAAGVIQFRGLAGGRTRVRRSSRGRHRRSHAGSAPAIESPSPPFVAPPDAKPSRRKSRNSSRRRGTV